MIKVVKRFNALVLAGVIAFLPCMLVSASQLETTTGYYMSQKAGLSKNSVPQQLQSSKTQSVDLPDNTQTSSNWAGYITLPSSGTEYQSVSGAWTVPDISGSQKSSVGAQWVGLGGVSNTDLLQIGTVEEFQNGKEVAWLFYEKLPAAAQYVTEVEVGSTVTTSVSESESTENLWYLTYTVTTPEGTTETDSISVTLDETYSAQIGTSAEWINEDPSNGSNQLYPLANTGTVSFTDTTVDGAAINATGNTVEPIALVSGNTVLLAPSELGSDGMSFTTYLVSSSSPGTNTAGTGTSGTASSAFPGSNREFDQSGTQGMQNPQTSRRAPGSMGGRGW
jgi:hypothetical protein